MEPDDKFERALLDPASVYANPQALLLDADLTRERKVEVLRRWKHDAAELDVAEEEGMGGGETITLQPILRALKRIGASVDTEHPPPTKHGGV